MPCGPYIGVNYEMVRNLRAQSSGRGFLAYFHSGSPFLAAPQRTVEVGVSVRIYLLQYDTYNSLNSTLFHLSWYRQCADNPPPSIFPYQLSAPSPPTDVYYSLLFEN